MQDITRLVEQWSNINSHTKNFFGIDILLNEVKTAFKILLPDEMRIIHFSQSKGLHLKKRGHSPIQIYLGGHLDTVFPANHSFQKAKYLDKNTLQGPGVTDMKGGLVVMLKALELFEKEKMHNLGWEIFLNSDEEIGSPESTPFIKACAKNCNIACLFEPTLEDGSFACQRKGSSNYCIISKGEKAHAGRNAEKGKNAIYPLTHFISQINHLHALPKNVLINVGIIKGGDAANVVPDYAECHLNLRAEHLADMEQVENVLEKMALDHDLIFKKLTFRPPKLFDQATQILFEDLKECASQLNLSLTWQASGGVCDGNTIAAQRIPTIDTLGVHGGAIHTDREYMYISSLYEKIQLTALFLKNIALGIVKIKENLHE